MTPRVRWTHRQVPTWPYPIWGEGVDGGEGKLCSNFLLHPGLLLNKFDTTFPTFRFRAALSSNRAPSYTGITRDVICA